MHYVDPQLRELVKLTAVIVTPENAIQQLRIAQQCIEARAENCRVADDRTTIEFGRRIIRAHTAPAPAISPIIANQAVDQY